MFRKKENGKLARARATAAALALTTFSLVGCGDDNPVTPVVESGTANLRVLHLSPDAPAVDVFLNQGSEATVSNLAFLSGTDYLEAAAGSYRIDVSANGGTATEAVLTVPSIALARDRSYTAVAYGNLSSISALALVDDPSALATGNIRVRAIHTAAAVGQVDIWNIPSSGDPAVLYGNVDFGVAGGYLDLPAGAYTIGFDVNDDASPDLVFDLPALAAGTVANVFAVSQGSDVFLVAQLQDGTIVRIDAN